MRQENGLPIHGFSHPAQVGEWLYPGLSPVFKTSDTFAIECYQHALENECNSQSLPWTPLCTKKDVVVLASMSNTCPSYIAALAYNLGFKYFQMWQKEAFILKRHVFDSPRDFIMARISPYLCLPVVTSSESLYDLDSDDDCEQDEQNDIDFHDRLERVAAKIGFGLYTVSTKTNKHCQNTEFIREDSLGLPSGKYLNSRMGTGLETECRFFIDKNENIVSSVVDMNCSSSVWNNASCGLQRRFDALVLAVMTRAHLFDSRRFCSTERKVFSNIMSSTFPSIASVLDSEPGGLHGRPIWYRGMKAWPGVHENGDKTLRDALKRCGVGTAGRIIDNWIMVTRDSDSVGAGTALMAELRRGSVSRSAVIKLDDVSSFLDLTAEAELMLEEDSEALRKEIFWQLLESGVLSDDDFVLKTRILHRSDDEILNTSLSVRVSRRGRTNHDLNN